MQFIKYTLLAVSVAVAAPALAQNSSAPASVPTNIAAGSSLDVTALFGVKRLSFDVVNGLGTSGDINNFDFLGQTDQGVELDATGRFANFALSAPLYDGYTRDAFVELTLEDVAQSRLSNLTTPDVPTGFTTLYVDVLPINGDLSPGHVFRNVTISPDYQTRSQIHFRSSQLSAGLGGVTTSAWGDFSLGYTVSQSELNLTSSVQLANRSSYLDLSETVETRSHGPVVRYATSGQIGPRMRYGFKLDLSALRSEGNLSALQSFVGDGDNFSAGTGSYAAASDRSDNAFMARLQFTLERQFSETGIFGFSVGFDMRNDLYSIVNPRSGPGIDSDNPASYAPQSAHLRQERSSAAFVGLNFTYRF